MTTETPKKSDEIAEEKLDQVAGGITAPTLTASALAAPTLDTTAERLRLRATTTTFDATLLAQPIKP
jgi:hypothetical protein